MLIKRISKTVYPNMTNSSVHMNFPMEAYELLGKNYVMELYTDKIVMYPDKELGKSE